MFNENVRMIAYTGNAEDSIQSEVILSIGQYGCSATFYISTDQAREMVAQLNAVIAKSEAEHSAMKIKEAA